MPRAWMPMYWGDYLADTGHLTTMQHGAYCLLIGHYWRCGALPDDDSQLANITKMPLQEWLLHRSVIQQFFFDGWRHKRVEAELRRSTEKMAKARLAGQKGGQTASMNREKMRYALQRLGSNR